MGLPRRASATCTSERHFRTNDTRGQDEESVNEGERESRGALHERELRRIVDTVLRLAKSTGAEETEVHVDEVADALTRFANNAIHQNVAEHGLTVSIRTVVEGRTARATTNRVMKTRSAPRSKLLSPLRTASRKIRASCRCPEGSAIAA